MKLRFAVLGALVLPLLATAVEEPQFGMRDDVPLEQTNKAPELKKIRKEMDRQPLNYVNQPPLIPHKVQGYQISQSTNRCLQCHDVENYLTTGAPRVSPTHFTDRDGVVQPHVAPRRYLCLQCHVTQADVNPPVANTFEGMGQFAKGKE
ncbi:periplasmic nitrate reductase subunit NapB [Ferrimonas sediminum]|uniref:Periplasmic nitrate reductase, electron transfer subunit n=1 Tax=Ferrimonas sediminum TaxID=718193 RepID=A0A1G8R563_9GAMM|nr:nitrate reductase cytochrome c-type subunit [Ferrimonas sediminum]SDJ11973.1 periplasmic nitrate reductase subunit NapB [Ferrimonas sediminum]